MAIIIDNSYIKINNDNTNKVSYAILSKETREFHIKYDKEFDLFIKEIGKYVDQLTNSIITFINNLNKTEEEINKKPKLLDPIKDDMQAKRALYDDISYLHNCYYRREQFDKTKLNCADFLYEIGLKEEWFTTNLVEEYVEDDTILSTNIKDKYEYLKKKFPGCQDC